MKCRASTAFCLAAAVLLAAPARAQTAPARRAKSAGPASTKSATPAAPAAAAASEPLPTIVVAPPPAAPAALAPSLAAEPSREEPFSKRSRAALLFGPELVDDQAGMKLRADVETDLLPPSARSVLSWVLSASAAYRGDEATASLAGVTTTATATSVMFELVPSLRARLAVTPALSIHADAGLGGAFSTSKLETKTDVSGLVTRTSSSSSAAGMVLRCGLGAGYAVSERASVAVELFGLNAHYGDTRGRSVTVLAGLTYQL
jgi:hypothetical protein